MQKPHFKKIVIAGVGLMGGSLGMAIRQGGLADQVAGFTRRALTIRQAKARGCIDSGTLSPSVAALGADLVVLAGPVSSTPEQLQLLLPHLPAGCLITDVGSTKTEVLRRIEQLTFTGNRDKKSSPGPRPNFVGSHPMAGSEKTSVRFARPDLYQGSLCILVKTPRTRPDDLMLLESFWRAVGCNQVACMTPQEHDRLTAVVSHLPHAVAVTLVNLVEELARRDARLVDVAASGFRDTTRIAASHPKMWLDIFMSNREEVVLVLEHYIERLTRFKNILQRSAQPALLKALEKANAFRRQMEKKEHA